MESPGWVKKQTGWRDDVTGRSGSPEGWQLMERSPCSHTHTPSHTQPGSDEEDTDLQKNVTLTGSTRTCWMECMILSLHDKAFFAEGCFPSADFSLDFHSGFLIIFSTLLSVALSLKAHQQVYWSNTSIWLECLLLCVQPIWLLDIISPAMLKSTVLWRNSCFGVRFNWSSLITTADNRDSRGKDQVLCTVVAVSHPTPNL